MSLAADLRMALDPVVLFEAAIGFAALDWQRRYLRADGNVCIVKSRQIGASTAAAALAVHSAIHHPATNSVIVSPTQKQSSEITIKARHALRTLGVRLTGDSASMITLANGSRVLSLPGTPKSVRGWSAKLLVIDEAAFVEPETWTAARALVATGGTTVVQSTPAEQAGDFYELVTGDDPGWLRLSIPASEVPTISAAHLGQVRRAMSPDDFAKEYECQFGRTGSSLFAIDQIDSMFARSA